MNNLSLRLAASMVLLSGFAIRSYAADVKTDITKLEQQYGKTR